jgi:proteasome assembly chaperone (PAC2) family protein
MASDTQLKDPWLVAVWPGMGHVAISAAYYMMSKLDMELLTEFPASELFDVEYVEVKRGLIQPVRRPRSRLFVWRDPQERQDIVIFTGEAQPEIHKFSLCQKIISFAQTLGIRRVFTFAAMATRMRPEHESRVFAAVTDAASLEELRHLEIELLESGQISGLNGVLMGAAAEVGLPGVCLLGEMPHVFMQFPFPKASLTVLERFTAIAGIELEMTEFYEHARVVDEQLSEILERVQQEMG